MNIRWGNTIEITKKEGKFFLEMQKSKSAFTYKDLDIENPISRLSGLVSKEALVSDAIEIKVRRTGVNIDPVKLPNLKNPEILSSHPSLVLD